MLQNRSELLFLYDVQWANPNGDPVDENKPRIDEETGRNIVTDVRLKRTIRDYLHDFCHQEIFVREIAGENEYIQDAKTRAEDFLVKDGKKLDKSKLSLAEMKQIINEEILRQCIDVRLFGVTLPIEKNSKEKSSITHTGPVQFKMGQSLHAVKLEYIKGTGAFASGSRMMQKTFREEYVLPYSLIAFYGVINEAAASYTKLTEEDVQLLLDAMWNGTKNLISRSKVGQIPRLLLRVVYKEKHFHIGELDKYISLHSEKVDEEIRDVSDYTLDTAPLIRAMEKQKEKIERVEIKTDDRLVCSEDIIESLKTAGIPVEIK
ncbi:MULTISPECIES: type I-B CRISPR-associated protein Cas7/Csh2 [Parageobacillus]|jgi:CRISPR-associated protein Csh2|uniref:Type I-B CRISPR-associated protein Cas7/Csh2 n=1 Tax=Parageobacillus thermoglucosidasius TaxID=1426 RepID=A0A1B7KMU1_PARTM|nr:MULTISPECIES: type I-B CRISPR-associated protein Cas7/Csh2 [Parageobacillus]OAT71407.1 type I-B CRISPR-associated protein Cas7/Csh2 [Parageobacillus thermoglucosidasius]BDG48936.1 type I-B CRISPR-associated protein Cas7/Csh2 [Parageobacillus sp. KH3-4]